MKQLRYLEDAYLYKATYQKQTNGANTETYVQEGWYLVQKQELNDQISASLYGARIRNMLRISSIGSMLESLLRSKTDTGSDNVSKYRIEIDGKKYKIVSVNYASIDLELI